ncbi:MAG: ABC transporter permease [Actinomycetales bacterium]|nr:ABC transporter permease [Actinomycetales bacterium]
MKSATLSVSPAEDVPQRRLLRRIVGAKEFGLLIAVVVLVVFLAIQSPNFLTAGNLTVVSRQVALALFISTGMTFVILAGQIDLSVGSVVALVSVSTGLLMVDAGLNPVLALPLAILAGALVGLFNGAVFAFTRIPSFVVTLGSMAMASGLALGLTTGSTISGFPSGFLFLGQGVWLGVPVPVWLAAVVALVAHLVLTKTVFGRHVFLIGSNTEAAVLSGVRVRAVKISIFVISSSLAAFASVIETARLSVGRPDAGSGYELVAIGAVVIGGASLFGGEGSILGTVLGTTLLGLILNGLIMLNISAYWQEMFSGAIIVLAVALNMRRRGGRAGGRGWAGVLARIQKKSSV